MKSNAKKAKQFKLFKPQKSDHGGGLKNPQKRARPLSTKDSMHIVLRSSEAKRAWSFKKYENEIDEILERFAIKYAIEIISVANVGNHIHLHIKLFKRRYYTPFIRAVTAAIMMKVTGFSKHRPKPKGFQFWDHRPFSRVIVSRRAFQVLVKYIQINIIEGMGITRQQAEAMVYRKEVFESS